MVYLLKMVIFNGYVSHNQMVNDISPALDDPLGAQLQAQIPATPFQLLVSKSENDGKMFV